MFIFRIKVHPLISKYFLTAVARLAVTMSLIVIFSDFEAIFNYLKSMSEDVAESLFPLKFLTPS